MAVEVMYRNQLALKESFEFRYQTILKILKYIFVYDFRIEVSFEIKFHWINYAKFKITIG